MPFRIAFPFERLHPVHTFSLRPFQRCRRLIHSGRAVAAEPAAVVEAVAAEVQVEAAPGVGAPAEAVEVAPAEVVRAVAVPEAVAKVAAPAELEAQEGAPEAARAVARVAALAVAVIILLTSTTRPTTSRGQSSRHSRLRHRPISRFWLRCPMEQAVS